MLHNNSLSAGAATGQSLAGLQGLGASFDAAHRSFFGGLGQLGGFGTLSSAPARALDMDFSSYISDCKKELEDDFLALSVKDSDGT